MGWRVSLYKANKENPIKIEYTEDSKYPDIEINGEQIAYDMATDAWCYLKEHNEEFKKEIVNLYDNPDCDYYTISKEGFKMLALEFRRRIIEYKEGEIRMEKPKFMEENYHYFDEDDNLINWYELDTNIEDLEENNEHELWWNITDKFNYNYHSFIDLRIMEIE